MRPRFLLAAGVICGGGALVSGLDYYLVPLRERPFSPLHELFAPTGLVGQGLGIVGAGMMLLGVGSYGARKRVRVLARFGKLKDWLHFHIFLCLLGPFLVLLHTSFKFGGLVAISFWSMTLVVTSGVFGRWVYVWIPKTQNGRFLGREEIRERMHSLLRDIGEESGIQPEGLLEILRPGSGRSLVAAHATDPTDVAAIESTDRRRTRRPTGVLVAVADAIRYRARRGRERARFQRELGAAGIAEPARSRIAARLEEESRIEQQLRMLHPFQSAFRYWHAFHLPLATVMLLVLVLHVGVAIAFGYTWIWAE